MRLRNIEPPVYNENRLKEEPLPNIDHESGDDHGSDHEKQLELNVLNHSNETGRQAIEGQLPPNENQNDIRLDSDHDDSKHDGFVTGLEWSESDQSIEITRDNQTKVKSTVTTPRTKHGMVMQSKLVVKIRVQTLVQTQVKIKLKVKSTAKILKTFHVSKSFCSWKRWFDTPNAIKIEPVILLEPCQSSNDALDNLLDEDLDEDSEVEDIFDESRMISKESFMVGFMFSKY